MYFRCLQTVDVEHRLSHLEPPAQFSASWCNYMTRQCLSLLEELSTVRYRRFVVPVVCAARRCTVLVERTPAVSRACASTPSVRGLIVLLCLQVLFDIALLCAHRPSLVVDLIPAS